ncbi:unnamed protein product [Kuraishia capsulata CBS 1993]|uniref:Mediator of RNA polymerase II transcription subunit 9 n=1 Tax=Kuraishia capsulata CBS 1993 TaxID=1382522 RepID=W6MKJ3_9ASCO|nr:uncharacterized protein KUCA_T00003006001 [Kuraishia capsulata CBS 1993]CDK27029.1 unnamed protein product [Kuraishia capsulata CBS 1993]
MSGLSKSPTPISHTVASASVSGTPRLGTPRLGSPVVSGNGETEEANSVNPEESEVDQMQLEQKTLDELKSIELLPLLLDLVEGLKIRRISPKDFDNAAGRIRVRVSRMRTLLNGIEGLDESHQSRLAKMKTMDDRISRKRVVLETFRDSVAERLDIES